MCGCTCVVVNEADSQFTPVQQFDYVGLHVDLAAKTVSVPNSWYEKTAAVVDSVVVSDEAVVRDVYRVFGCLIWMCLVHNLPMCLLSPALRHWSVLSKGDLSLDSTVVLPDSLRQWLQEQFFSLSHRVSGVGTYDLCRDVDYPIVVCSSDSSSYGAGFFVGEFVNSWEWPAAEAAWHIYSKELSSALRSIDCALTLYPRHDIHLELDNTPSIHTLAHWYSKGAYWNSHLYTMWQRVRDAQVRLSLEYVHTSVHRSDVLSRYPCYTGAPVHVSTYPGRMTL